MFEKLCPEGTTMSCCTESKKYKKASIVIYKKNGPFDYNKDISGMYACNFEKENL